MVHEWEFNHIFYNTKLQKEKVGDETWGQVESARRGSRKTLQLLKKRVTGSNLHLRRTNRAVV